MGSGLRHNIAQLIRGKCEAPDALKAFLLAASSVYSFGATINRVAYQKGWRRTTTLPIPVVCVGNATWGGTGKTPMVEYIAKHYLKSGDVPLILTRVNSCNLILLFPSFFPPRAMETMNTFN